MEKLKIFQTDPSLKLMDRVNQALVYYQYAFRTQQSYKKWIKEYIRYLGKRKVPENRFHKEINSFVSYLSRKRGLSPSSCKQALNAISFLYKRVFDVPVDISVKPVKTRTDPTLPLVMTKDEIRRIFNHLKGKHLLMARLLYGAGLRLMECVRLRVHNLNFEHNLIIIQALKGGKKRSVMMPACIREHLLNQLEKVRYQHQTDLKSNAGNVVLPGGLSERYEGTQADFSRQYVFPSKRVSIDKQSGLKGRTHVLESGLQKAVHTAVKKAGIEKKISCNTFRHSFAAHLLQENIDLKTVQELMGHADIRTTQVYMQLLEKKDITQISPLDTL